MVAQLPIPMIKLAAQVVSGLGVMKIVGGIVKNNVPIVTTMDKVVVNAGSFVLGSILWDQSSNHIEETVGKIVAWIDERETTPETPADTTVNGS